MFFSAAGYALQYHHKKNMQLITFLVFMVLFWNCMPSNVILLPFFSYWFENANQYFVTNDNIFTLSLTEFRIPYQQFPSSWYLNPLLSYDVISSVLLAGFFFWFHNALLMKYIRKSEMATALTISRIVYLLLRFFPGIWNNCSVF